MMKKNLTMIISKLIHPNIAINEHTIILLERISNPLPKDKPMDHFTLGIKPNQHWWTEFSIPNWHSHSNSSKTTLPTQKGPNQTCLDNLTILSSQMGCGSTLSSTDKMTSTKSSWAIMHLTPNTISPRWSVMLTSLSTQVQALNTTQKPLRLMANGQLLSLQPNRFVSLPICIRQTNSSTTNDSLLAIWH